MTFPAPCGEDGLKARMPNNLSYGDPDVEEWWCAILRGSTPDVERSGGVLYYEAPDVERSVTC